MRIDVFVVVFIFILKILNQILEHKRRHHGEKKSVAVEQGIDAAAADILVILGRVGDSVERVIKDVFSA